MGIAVDDPLVVLLHGLGATGAVWYGVAEELGALGYQTWCPDLPGHGETPGKSPYTLGQLADSVGRALGPEQPWFACGHSLGGYVALELAAGRRATPPLAAVSVGAKLAFSDEERARMAELALRPVRAVPTRGEAIERYCRVAGLAISIDAAYLERAVVVAGGGFALAQDPAVAGIVVPAFAPLAAAAVCPVYVARGEFDTLVSHSDCVALGLPLEEFTGLGHNAHAEDPPRIARYLAGVLRHHEPD